MFVDTANLGSCSSRQFGIASRKGLPTENASPSMAVDQGRANNQHSAKASDTVDLDDLARIRRSVREYLGTLDEVGWATQPVLYQPAIS
ncbi:hypothetical protein AB4Z10_29090 [Bosea sp. RAF48]|uniref:hypothetical protein n=1 Tax=Bosea sp. RAF48 TaxID=3237480 RepID=UPI003F939B46